MGTLLRNIATIYTVELQLIMGTLLRNIATIFTHGLAPIMLADPRASTVPTYVLISPMGTLLPRSTLLASLDIRSLSFSNSSFKHWFGIHFPWSCVSYLVEIDGNRIQPFIATLHLVKIRARRMLFL